MKNRHDICLIEQDISDKGSFAEQDADDTLTPTVCNQYYEAEQSSFEEVAATVPNKDDPSIPSFTLRSILLGLAYVIGMSFFHQWTYTSVYRFYIGPVLVIFTSHLFGRLPLIFKCTPFSIKEHTVVLLMANVAWWFNNQYQYATLGLIRQMEDGRLKYVHIFFLVVSLQFLGFGLSGNLRRFLVWPSGQIWPSNMPWIALLRTLHEDQHAVQTKVYGTKKRSLWWQLIDNRKCFFYLFSVLQFIYCWLPQYIMRVLSNFSWMCMISPNNFLLSQLTGYRGLGVGSLSFDWQTVSNFLGSPLVIPGWAVINIAVGFVIVTWILTPILYFTNVWNCKEQSIGYFPVGGVLNTGNNAWSALGIATTATGFATPIAVLVHMFLHHGKEFWMLLRTRSAQFKGNDLHCRLISTYRDVPDWWYILITLLTIPVLIIISEVSNTLHWSYVFLALLFPLIFALPLGSVFSVTGQIVQNAAGYYVCLVVAYAIFGDSKVSDGRTLFITIAYTGFCQTLYRISDMKLAHYMKIPPRVVFFVQALACLVCSALSVVTEQYYKQSLDNSYPARLVQYVTLADFCETSAFISSNFFGSNSPYRVFLWIMIGGAILPLPFWLAGHRWAWCRQVHIPLMLIFVSWMPAAPAGTIFTWIIIGLVRVTVIRKACWKRHVYLFSAALDIGLNIMILIVGFTLWNNHIPFPKWWGTGGLHYDGCPLALNGTVSNWFFLTLDTRLN